MAERPPMEMVVVGAPGCDVLLDARRGALRAEFVRPAGHRGSLLPVPFMVRAPASNDETPSPAPELEVFRQSAFRSAPGDLRLTHRGPLTREHLRRYLAAASPQARIVVTLWPHGD